MSCMSSPVAPGRRRRSALGPCIACVLLLLIASGCRPSGGRSSGGTTGGDIPLTTERLQNVTLTQIGSGGLTWRFAERRLEILNEQRPISPAPVESVCGPGQEPKQITATWELIATENTLKLTSLRVDGRPLDDDVWLPITPAGPIRVNLAELQYNLQRADQPLQVTDRAGPNADLPNANPAQNDRTNGDGKDSAEQPAGDERAANAASGSTPRKSTAPQNEWPNLLEEEMRQAALELPGAADNPNAVQQELAAAIATGRQLDPTYLTLSAEQRERLLAGTVLANTEKRIAAAQQTLNGFGVPLPALAQSLLQQHASGKLSAVRTELLAQVLSLQAQTLMKALQ